MMKKIKTFRAPDMQSALDLVRREMGQDAAILHTKELNHRRRFPWTKRETEVEITAGIDPQIKTTLTANNRPQQNTKPVVTQNKKKETVAVGTNSAQPNALNKSGSGNGGKSLAMQLLSQIGQDPDEVQLENLTSERAKFSKSERQPIKPRTRQSILERPLTTRSKAETNTRSIRQEQQAVPEKRKPTAQSRQVTADGHKFEERLRNIEKMLLQLGRQATTQSIQEIPNELFQLYTELIDADVHETTARDLIFELKQKCRPQDLQTPERTKAVLTGMLEQQFNCCGAIEVTPGRRKVVALVGATGVGKTTTIAKLAANFKLRQGIKVGLVTVDTYRIAAVEQLKTYAEIMEIPLKVVGNSAEMRQALDHLQGLDLVLIDTGGRSPNDDSKIQELKSLLHEARADEVHVVLNLNSNSRSLESTAQKFQEIGSTSMLLSKLDETTGLGAMVGLTRNVSLPVSYLTTGQDVPEDYEPAVASRMVRLLLGEETLN